MLNLMVNPNVGKKNHFHVCPRVRMFYGQDIKREGERKEINDLEERGKSISLRKETKKQSKKSENIIKGEGKNHQMR